MNSYQKLKRHLKDAGLFYAIWKGIKYFVFLIRRHKENLKQKPINVISRDRIKLCYLNNSIKIFWGDHEITKDPGLNVSVTTLGISTDSSKADWGVIERSKDQFKLRIVFKDIPLSQDWTIKIENGNRISWKISMEAEEYLHIDEFRIVCLINVRYGVWFSDYREEDFPPLNGCWQDLCLSNRPTSVVGARPSVQDLFLPPIVLKSEEDRNRVLPLIQNQPENSDARIIGFRKLNREETDFAFGHHHIFSSRINLSEDDILSGKDTKKEA